MEKLGRCVEDQGRSRTDGPSLLRSKVSLVHGVLSHKSGNTSVYEYFNYVKKEESMTVKEKTSSRFR